MVMDLDKMKFLSEQFCRMQSFVVVAWKFGTSTLYVKYGLQENKLQIYWWVELQIH